MESKRSTPESGTPEAAPDWTGPRIGHAAFAAKIERRRAEADVRELPRNSGNRRTASKKALLTAIEDAGGTW